MNNNIILPKLCLNMIVKNESKVIIPLLQSVSSIIDTYCICDTGSTDDTIDIITTFFSNINIPGLVFSEPFVNFEYSRNFALTKCYGLSEYVLLLDADNILEIFNFDKNELLNGINNYSLLQGNSNFHYKNKRIILNNGNFKYKGVTHEYLSGPGNDIVLDKSIIFVNDVGNGGSKENKYIRDIELLSKGIIDEPTNTRYHFYLANSYKDTGNFDKAIEYYKKLIAFDDAWWEEKYISCIRIYECLESTGFQTQGIFYLIESYIYSPSRIEGIFLLIQYYTCRNHHQIAYSFYSLIKDQFQIDNIKNSNNKLFVNARDYSFNLPYYMIIVSEQVKKLNEGIKMYLIIFECKAKPEQLFINNLIYNLQFFVDSIDENFIVKFKEYITFLEKENIKINYSIINKITSISTKKTILIYVGFCIPQWNKEYSITNALGGSEKAVIQLCTQLTQLNKEYSIIITGDVIPETIPGIQFINRFNIHELIEKTHFDCIIVSRYVSFFTIFPNIKYSRLILMAHDIHLLNNLTGCNKSVLNILEEWNNKIDYCVCLTEWHKELFKKEYPVLSNKIKIINNGIDITAFDKTHQKISNSFIYTSGAYRGLSILLELWPKILEIFPDATLNISSYIVFPSNDEDTLLLDIINNNNTIKHFGKLNQKELTALMSKSEYWLYPCIFKETSCITAMEMLASEVICLYYPIAGLTDTMGNYGIQISPGNEISTLLDLYLSPRRKADLRSNGKKYSIECSWKLRAVEWNKLINNNRIFYASKSFDKNLLFEYINSLNYNGNNILWSNTINIDQLQGINEIIIVYQIFDSSIFDLKELNIKISYLNTEPLNISHRLNYIIKNVIGEYPDITIYDYSLSNIKILNDNGIKNIIHLPYLINQKEINSLKELLIINTNKEYDFGIISSNGIDTTCIDTLTPPRRKKIVEYLLSQGFTVNFITGFDDNRDIELSKCKKILNIHGEYLNESSNIFEHIRCDRLLHAGFEILSESNYYLDQTFINQFPNLKIIDYQDFFNITNTPKIIDCFTFYNELELLEYRLEILSPTVDYFILVEATRTHAGNQKELFFQRNSTKFNKFSDKIIHIIVDDFPYAFNPSPEEVWKNEIFQRNCIQRGIDLLKEVLLPDDYIIVSDVDEIPDPNTINNLKNNSIEDIAKLEQDLYYYNLCSKLVDKWYASKIFKYSKYLSLNINIDDIRKYQNCISIFRGGWHLSYFGNPDFINNKIKNFAHQEYNNPEYTDLLLIEQRVTNGLDLYNRDIKIINIPIINNNYLPPRYQEYFKKYLLDHPKSKCSENLLHDLSLYYKLDKNYEGIYIKKIYSNKNYFPMNIKEGYLNRCKQESDINEHLPTLYKYATDCESIFETGVRSCISSYAFAYGLLNNNNSIKKYLLNDISDCTPDINELFNNCKELIDIKYQWCNNLLLNFTETYDLTFIDTWHVYGQLKRELIKFAPFTNKYIILHDTTVDEWYGENARGGHNDEEDSIYSGIPIEEIQKGLWPAIDEFLISNPEWVLHERFTNNNGLTILKKIRIILNNNQY